MKINWQGVLSMTFLITALALFMAFHVLPMDSGWKWGWRIWPDLCGELWDHPQIIFRELKPSIGIFSFLCSSLLIGASPFLKNVWPKSRLAWWFAVIFSGLVAAVFWGIYFNGIRRNLGLGSWCFMLAPVLNFVGLLLARPQWLRKSGPSSPPENQAAV